MGEDARDIPALVVSGLTKRIGRRRVLHGCDFELPRGASLVVFGPNGAGKTTLLRILATLDRPSAGSYHALGFDALGQADELRARVGLVSHAPMLYPDLTAAENLMFYARLYGVADPGRRVDELLELVELSARQDDAVRGFSRGMTQRVCLARALVNDPELVLLDEPYSGLDPHAARIVEELLAHHAVGFQDGFARTLVSVSHDVEHGYGQASHVLLLERGRQRLFAPVDELRLDVLADSFAALVGEGPSRG